MEVACFFIPLGIDSISFNPASLLRAMTIVHGAEQAAVAIAAG